MPAAMRCSRWSALSVRTILMRRICQSFRWRAARQSPGNRRRPTGMRGRRRFPQPRRKGPRRKPARAPSPVPADQSAALRDRLLDEIAGLGSADAAASWAHDGLTAKNRLTAADAKAVEEAFERRLAELAREDCGPLPPPVEPESSDLTTTPSSPSSAAPATE